MASFNRSPQFQLLSSISIAILGQQMRVEKGYSKASFKRAATSFDLTGGDVNFRMISPSIPYFAFFVVKFKIGVFSEIGRNRELCWVCENLK